jgi:hypothetical protein
MTYAEQLQHPKWQACRLEILQREKFACYTCGDKETTLHIHHREYEKGKLAWAYPKDNFQALCKHCHQLAEFLKKAGYHRFVHAYKIPFTAIGEEVFCCTAVYITGEPHAVYITKHSPKKLSIRFIATREDFALIDKASKELSKTQD